jgi:two-component system KDP operon response regulator KdpE
MVKQKRRLASHLAHRVVAAIRGDASADALPALVQCGNVTIDRERPLFIRNGLPVSLSPAEHQVLLRLAQHPGAVADPETLFDDAWAPDGFGECDYLRMFMRRLRRKLGDEGPCHPKVVVGMGTRGHRLGDP